MMRKLVNFYMTYMIVAMFVFSMAFFISDMNFFGVLGISTLILTVVFSMSMTNVKWHMNHKEMVDAKRDSDRIVRNCTELIDRVKRELFRQNIMSKEEVNEILDKE